MNAPVPRRQSRFRYRLRTLLALMALVAVAGAAFGNHLRAIRREQEAFRQITAKGGWVLDYQGGVSIGFGPPPWKGPNSFLCGTGLRGAYEPTSNEITFCDRDIPLLNDAVRLKAVSFEGTLVFPAARNIFKESHKDCRISD